MIELQSADIRKKLNQNNSECNTPSRGGYKSKQSLS